MILTVTATFRRRTSASCYHICRSSATYRFKMCRTWLKPRATSACHPWPNQLDRQKRWFRLGHLRGRWIGQSSGKASTRTKKEKMSTIGTACVIRRTSINSLSTFSTITYQAALRSTWVTSITSLLTSTSVLRCSTLWWPSCMKSCHAPRVSSGWRDNTATGTGEKIRLHPRFAR